jgi:hypothetical protein
MDEKTVDHPVDHASSPADEEGHAGGRHGSTPAAWTAVTIVLVAFTLGAVAMVLGPNWLLFWISVGLAFAGGLVGKVMQLLGFGADPGDHAAH